MKDGQVGKERVGLEDHAEVRAWAGRGDVLAVDDDAAGGGLEEAGDQVERRGLAAAGRTEQREQLALVHGEIDRVHARRPPKSRVHPLSSTTTRAITGGGGTPPRIDRAIDQPDHQERGDDEQGRGAAIVGSV